MLLPSEEPQTLARAGNLPGPRFAYDRRTLNHRNFWRGQVRSVIARVVTRAHRMRQYSVCRGRADDLAEGLGFRDAATDTFPEMETSLAGCRQRIGIPQYAETSL